MPTSGRNDQPPHGSAQESSDLFVGGEAAGLLLGEEPAAAGFDIEDASGARDDRHGSKLMLMFLEQFGRQTDGLIEVASAGAVGDAQIHPSSLS